MNRFVRSAVSALLLLSVSWAQEDSDSGPPAPFEDPNALIPHPNWQPPVIHGFPSQPALGMDEGVDIVVWYEDLGLQVPGKTWAFVAGVMTNNYGGKVFAVYRYPASDPRNTNLWKANFYPANYLTTTKQHIPRAMAVNPDNGDIYVTGSTTNAAGNTDYATVRFDKELAIVGGWGEDGAITYDGDGHGNDVAVDIAVMGDWNNRFVAITGTAWDDVNRKDIVTMMYYTKPASGPESQPRELTDPDAWTDWRSVYDHPVYHGDDVAVELGSVAMVQDSQTGSGVGVAGSTWSGQQARLDMVALLYKPRSGADKFPPLRYNGPGGGDDICTGLATQGSALTAIMVLCGSTRPVFPTVPEDTEYLTWAVYAGTGTNLWPAEGQPYGHGRAWKPSPLGHGPDVARDITYGLDGQTVWVTGEARVGEGFDVGTVGYYVNAPLGGQLVASSLFNSPMAEGRDDKALAIAFQPNVGLYVTGGTETYGSSVFTLHYGPELTVDHVGRFRLGPACRGRALFLHVDRNEPSGTGIYVTGTVGNFLNGQDWVTLRYGLR